MGLAFTRHLLDRGDTVLAAVRDPSRASALVALGEVHGGLAVIPLDVSSPSSIEAMASEVGSRVDHLDLLVNNAGINSRGVPKGQANVRFGELEPEGILRMVAVNAVGPLLVTQALVELLAQGTHPRVVCLSSWLGSIAGKRSGGNYGYCASKATMNMLVRAMACDLAPQGITAVAVNPGWVSTDMGGPQATLDPDEAVTGMLSVIDGLTPSDAGRFLQWNGTELAW